MEHSIVSQGIIDAVEDDKITKPIVVRMKGTGSEDAAKVVSLESSAGIAFANRLNRLLTYHPSCAQLQASGLEFAFHDDFNAAAAHAVKAANQGHL